MREAANIIIPVLAEAIAVLFFIGVAVLWAGILTGIL